MDPSAFPEVLCQALFSVNTEDVKYAKADVSSLAATFWASVDPLFFGIPLPPFPAGDPLDLTDLYGLVFTGGNGAWGKTDNIEDFAFTRQTAAVPGGAPRVYYELDIDYKTKGFNPTP